MRIGFIGTGAISEAIITGLFRSEYDVSEIIVSVRNRNISSRLAERYDRVRVCENNQDIVDAADLVFLAVLPQVAEDVLKPLRFRKTQKIASLIATVTGDKLTEWLGSGLDITRALPLPPVADLRGVTSIYPHSDLLKELFSRMGATVTAKSEEEFDVYAVASAMMETYFGSLETAAQWFCAKGVDYANARACLSQLFLSLALTAKESPEKSFNDLRADHTSAGGINEQMFRVFGEQDGLKALNTSLDSVYQRLKDAG